MEAQKERVYFGKPENQKDAKAVNKHNPKKVEEAPQQKPKNTSRPIPKLVSPPDNSNHRTGDPFSESIFGRGLSVREYNTRTKFQPTLVASIEISRQCYQQIKTDDVQITKQLLPEYVDYYTTFCVWARLVQIKSKNQESLTTEEEWLMDIIRNREYSLMDPITTYLKSIGNVVALTGQHLAPSFPELPNTTVNGKPGFFGVIDEQTHNLYEEIPTFGVLAEAIQYAVGSSPPGEYPSCLSTTTAKVNSNLIGYRPLQTRRQEAKDLAFSHGITDNQFPSSKGNTGINIGLINAVSDIIANIKTFKITKTNFAEMSISGSQAQLINLHRTDTDNTPDVKAELQPYSLIKEKESAYGLAIFSSLQLSKSSADLATAPTTWLCITPMQPPRVQDQEPTPTPDYANWIRNRNIRRDLPIQFKQKVFLTTSQPAATFREDVITSLVLTKR